MKLDLHVHTTCSDGTVPPGELLALARAEGLDLISVCDHDTVAAYAELGLDGDRPAVLPGIELSVEFPGGTFHLLGYGLDPGHPELVERLAELAAWRGERNRRMIELLQAEGIAITEEELFAIAEGVPGRPHMARLMVAQGAVADVQEAFDRYLAQGRPCYVPKSRLEPADGIALVHAAGGAAVLAHPYQLRLSDEELAAAVAICAALGLDGIECYYPQHSGTMTRLYESLAAKYGLCRTGGSDYHGAVKPSVRLGHVAGRIPDPEALLAELRAAAERYR